MISRQICLLSRYWTDFQAFLPAYFLRGGVMSEARDLLERAVSFIETNHFIGHDESERYELNKDLCKYLAKPEQEPIGYLPASSARTILNQGSWDGFCIYKNKQEDDVPVYFATPETTSLIDDANRYRWIKNPDRKTPDYDDEFNDESIGMIDCVFVLEGNGCATSATGEVLDAAIDAAMNKEGAE